ncbi:type IV secretion protein Dot, partial [Legionella pneumophila serogroup 3]
ETMEQRTKMMQMMMQMMQMMMDRQMMGCPMMKNQ